MYQKIESMSENNEIVVGLDIGTTKIAVLVGEKTEHGKLNVLGMGKAPSLGVKRGVVTHLSPTVDAIEKAVKEAEDQSGVEINVVNVGIAGKHIKSLQHRASKIRTRPEDEITKKDIDELIEDMNRLVMLPGEQIIDVIPQDFTVDQEHGILDPIGMSGSRFEANFHVITGHMTAVSNIYRCVRRAGLEVQNLILEPLASADAVLTKEEKEAGVVLVDIGGGTTDVAIFKEGIIRHTAVIPYGGNSLTYDIKEGCSIIERQAQLLKERFGYAIADSASDSEIIAIPGLPGREHKEISVKNLAHIIQARMEEIIEQVYYEITNSGFEKKLIAGIVVTGGGSQLRHVKQLFEFMTGLETNIGTPTKHLASSKNDISSPSFATGTGLVVKGFERSGEGSAEVRTEKEEKNKDKFGMKSFLDMIKGMMTENDI